MSGGDGQLATEQGVVDVLYSRLDALREQTRRRLAARRRGGPTGAPQNRSERDAFATLYEDRIAALESVEDRLCFGRLDLLEGGTRYIGRIGLTDEQHTSILTDWRAPAAQSFYRATAAHPDGVVRRRHIITRARTVTGLEDDVLDLDSFSGNPGDLVGASGEGALLAALGARRTGHMGDIVATIQAEQDAIIRSDLAGVLVVQGGPGTGKTAVALHRAAFLLYAHRRSLERTGVLLVGPSRTFLRYIDQVLPSLGETGAVTATISELIPGVRATAEDSEEVAEIKGRAVMAQVVARAVRQRQRVPRQREEIRVDGHTVVVEPRDVAEARAKARRSGSPHNQARVVFVREMLSRLATQYITDLGHPVAPEDRADIIEELRTTREVRIALNLAWMPLTPQGLVSSLLARPDRLAAAAHELSPRDRRLLARPADVPWTTADIPLLDEAAELLGEDDQASRAQAHADAERRRQEVEYARDVVRETGGGLVSAEMLADRFSAGGPRMTTAERAAADRSWTYGHIVVDEAQELSAMAWRMLLRRCPTRSMTVVGDVAQTSTRAGARSWAERLDPLLDRWRMAELTVNYRTPAQVAELAARVARAAGAVVGPLTSARDLPGAVELHEAGPAGLADAAAGCAAAAWAALDDDAGDGRVAVIAPAGLHAAIHAAAGRELPPGSLPSAGTVDLTRGVNILTARGTKGLEFDHVVLVEPAQVLAEGGAGDLYVALSRPTHRLDVVHAQGLPAGFE